MPKSDPRYDAWPHRKPSKKSKARARIEELTGLDAAEAAAVQSIATPVAKRAVTVGRRIAGKVGGGVAAASVAAGEAVGLGALTTASLVVITGLASYFATKALMSGYKSQADLDYAAANEYRNARREFATRMGRPLTAEENKALGEEFKRQLIANAGHVTQQTGRFGRI